jgi:hypothetical protein
MTVEQDRMLAQGPRQVPEPGVAAPSGPVVTVPKKSLGRLGRALVLAAAALVLVGMTVAHSLGPASFVAVWVLIGIAQLLRRLARR